MVILQVLRLPPGFQPSLTSPGAGFTTKPTRWTQESNCGERRSPAACTRRYPPLWRRSADRGSRRQALRGGPYPFRSMSNEDQASETAPARPRTDTAPITATQHTPWKQRRESRATGAGVVNTRGLPVCDVFGDSFEERESRSRLFAAAPELLGRSITPPRHWTLFWRTTGKKCHPRTKWAVSVF